MIQKLQCSDQHAHRRLRVGVRGGVQPAAVGEQRTTLAGGGEGSRSRSGAAQRAGGASPAEAEVLRNLTEVAAGLGVAVEGEDGVQDEVAVGAAEGEEACAHLLENDELVRWE